MIMPAIDTEAAIYGDCQWFFASERSEINLVPSSYHDRKAIIDRILGLFLLLLAAVPLAMLLAVVRLSLRGPALFRQLRVGKNGRPFVMYKLRTMRTDAEAVTGPVWGLPHDPRATCVGKLLRKLHLDELPQLINVLKGEMSLVGPRPERPEFVPALSDRNCRLFGPDCRPAGHHRPGPAQPSARQRPGQRAPQAGSRSRVHRPGEPMARLPVAGLHVAAGGQASGSLAAALVWAAPDG